MFIVVGRANGSKPEDIDSWGHKAIIVDQWYANQQQKPDPNNPISPTYKKAETQEGNTYWEWLKKQQDFQLVLEVVPAKTAK